MVGRMGGFLEMHTWRGCPMHYIGLVDLLFLSLSPFQRRCRNMLVRRNEQKRTPLWEHRDGIGRDCVPNRQRGCRSGYSGL